MPSLMIILPNGDPLLNGSTVLAQAVYTGGRAPGGGLSLLQKYGNDRAFSPIPGAEQNGNAIQADWTITPGASTSVTLQATSADGTASASQSFQIS